jgi:type II secretory pathway pseudopilin PulG
VRRSHHRADRRDETGETLIEVLIALLILSIGVVGILGGLETLRSTATVNRNLVDVGTVLRTAAESISADGYHPCTTFASASGFYTLPANVGGVPLEGDANGAVILKITGQGGLGTPLMQNNVPLSDCGADPGIQMIELSATSANGLTKQVLWMAMTSATPH